MSLSTRIILNVTHNQPCKQQPSTVPKVSQPKLKLQTHPNNEMLDYLIELRETRLDAFTSIILGLKNDNSNNNDIQRLQPHLQFIFQF